MRTLRLSAKRGLAAALAALATGGALTAAPPSSTARSSAASPLSLAARLPTPVTATRVIGHSVHGRPIVAYHLGDPSLPSVALLLGEMHGDEPAGVALTEALIHGRRGIAGLNLWVVPTMNPDGYAARTRGNAHGVDLNRNWADKWAPLSGEYYSGPRPWSEPETRAMHRFLLRVRPHYIVSLHQPLGGVDTTDGGALDPAFRRRLVHNLGLPPKAFRCWSVCHGSMTGWYTTKRFGIGETIEFGSHPTHRYLVGRALSGIIDALGGRLDPLRNHDPRSRLWTRGSTGHVRVGGWAFDVDARDRPVKYALALDGNVATGGRADVASPDLDRRNRLAGGHRLATTVAVGPGTHRVCVTFENIGAGTRDPRSCVSVVVPASTAG